MSDIVKEDEVEMPMPPTKEHTLVQLLSAHLKDWDVVGAEEVIDRLEYQEWIKENGAFDLIPIIIEYLDEEHEQMCPQLVNTCRILLEKLAQKCSPKEVLIALIEHCEAFISVPYNMIITVDRARRHEVLGPIIEENPQVFS